LEDLAHAKQMLKDKFHHQRRFENLQETGKHVVDTAALMLAKRGLTWDGDGFQKVI
jgi:hypothetical protein